MIEFGKTLRIAREAKGFTTSQIADKTHMLVQVVEGLENEDFSRIVAPIYGRGFVKLYCEAVGLEPKPLVDEFMEIYSGNRPATIRERPTPAAPAPAAPAAPVAPEPVAEPEIPVPKAPEPPPPELDFTGIRTHAEAPKAAPAAVSEPPPAHAPSRYAAPLPIDDGPSFTLPAINWRMIVLAAATIAVLVLIGFGVRALYRATMSVPEDEKTNAAPDAVAQPVETAKPAETARPATASQAAKPQTEKRQPLPAKPFYID